MRGEHYRLRNPVLAIYTDRDQHKIPVTLPQHAVVEALDEVNANRLIDVRWEGKVVMMFTIDLRNRCDKVASTHN